MTDEDKYTESLMPTLFASLETKVNSWLTLRFGGRKGVFYTVEVREHRPDLRSRTSRRTATRRSSSSPARA